LPAVVEPIAPQGPPQLESLDLEDQAQLAAYIQEVASDGDLPIPSGARQFMDAETAMYGFLARYMSETVLGFVTGLIEEINEDNAREEKLIFGHALTYRMRKDRAPFRHVPNAGLSKENAIVLAGILMETGDFQQNFVSQELERDTIADLIFFLSALLTDICLSLGVTIGNSRFDSTFKDNGMQEIQNLLPGFREFARQASADLSMEVAEREIAALPAEATLAFAGRKDLLRLTVVLALYFVYGFNWYSEARILGKRIQPYLTCTDEKGHRSAREAGSGEVAAAEKPWFDFSDLYRGVGW